MADPLLVLEHITKQYTGTGNDTPEFIVLDDLNLTVNEGETLAVVGPSGSGKSTLLNIIGALDRPTSGNILIEGTNISTHDDKALSQIRNRKIGFIFQFHHLLPQCSVLENILIPTLVNEESLQEKAEAKALQLLQRVGLADRIHHRPGQLSGGECQRVAVVRALINEPILLLADEPTGSLDQHSSESLANLLIDLNREEGTTLVVVTHSADLASRMDRKFLLEGGKLKLSE